MKFWSSDLSKCDFFTLLINYFCGLALSSIWPVVHVEYVQGFIVGQEDFRLRALLCWFALSGEIILNILGFACRAIMIYFCGKCDPTRTNPIQGHSKCPTCKTELQWWCQKTRHGGVYRSFYEHRKTCLTCRGAWRDDPRLQQEMHEAIQRKSTQLQAAQDAQEPYASWRKDAKLLKRKTGVNGTVFDLVLTSTRVLLAALHGKKKFQGG